MNAMVLTVATASFVLSLILTPLFRNVFRALGIVDQPDGRKLHSTPIPRVGGVPIAIAYVAASAVPLLMPLLGLNGGAHHVLPFRLLPAITIIFITGLLDDLFTLTPWQKLGGELAAALLAYYAGVRILDITGYSVAGWLSLSLTVLWLLACTNAFNLIDGVDGLASGLGLSATCTILASAMLLGKTELVLATAPLAGALLAFLVFNSNPATIFLGDSGSLLIGFILGCFGTLWGQKSATLLGITAPLIALAIPLLDVGLSILRRFLRRQPIFGADRGHIHHRLLDRGFTPRRVAFVLYAASGIFAILSLLSSMLHDEYLGLIVVAFAMITWFGIHNLHYAEFRLARRIILGGAFSNMLNAQLLLGKIDRSLAAARSIEELWAVVREASRQFGFNRVQMCLNGAYFNDDAGGAEEDRCWNVRVPLSRTEYVILTSRFTSTDLPTPVVLLVNVLRANFERRTARFGNAAGLFTEPTTSRVAATATASLVEGN